MHALSTVLLGALAVLLSGCASTPPSGVTFAATPPQDRSAYTGTLTTPPTSSRTGQRPGTAGEVVRCSVPPTGGTIRPGSRQAPAGSPEQAVDEQVGSELPVQRLAREREDADRVLFTTSYGGVARQAVIVRRSDPAADAAAPDREGWYVESYASCDLADFPEAVSAAAGVQIWSDARGARRATTVIVSSRGPEHCGLQATTFLVLDDRGAAQPRAYVDQIPGGMDGNFAERPVAHVPVPADAHDTGFTRKDEHLWLSPDRARAYVGSRADAALWPRELQAFGCA